MASAAAVNFLVSSAVAISCLRTSAVVVGLFASAVAVVGLVASAVAVNSWPSAGSKEQLGRVLHATASKISLQDWQKFNLNRFMKSKLIPSKS